MTNRRNEPRDDDAGLDRLRVSRSKRKEEGRALGRKWALEVADADQVERIGALSDEGFMTGRINAPFVWLDLVVAAHQGWEPADVVPNATREFLDACLAGDDSPSDILLRGFVEGVTEIRNKMATLE